MRYRVDLNVVKLISGQFITQILDRSLFVCIIWFISKNYSRSELSIFLSVVTVPYLFSLFFSSRIINRIGQIKVVFGVDFIRAVFLLAVYFLEGNSYSIIELGFILFVANSLSSLFEPAILSLPPLMLAKTDSHKITALLNMCYSIGSIAGPLFSIKIYNTYGLNALFFLSAMAYFFSGIMEFTIKLERVEVTSNLIRNKLESFGEKLAEMSPVVLFFLIFGLLINLLFVPIQFFIPVYVQTILKSDATIYTYLQISMGLGAVLGSIFISVFSGFNGKKETIRPMMFYLMSGISYILFSFSASIPVSIVSVFFIDFFLCAGNILVLSFYQADTDSLKLPFVMSCVMFISVSSSPLAMFLAGIVSSWYSLNLVITSYALITISLIAIAFVILLSMNRSDLKKNQQEKLCVH